MQNCSPLTLLCNKLSEQYIIVTMCMLPAQYHVWLAIFTPLIADKFLVRPKEYIKIAGMYAYSELQKIIKACISSPCITNISQITLQQHSKTDFGRIEI